MKTNIPQILFVGLEAKCLVSSYLKRGQPSLTKAEVEKAMSPDGRSQALFASLFSVCLYMGIALCGGAKGLGLMAFSAYVFGLVSYASNRIKQGKVKPYSPYHEAALIALEVALLYWAGFWN